VKDVAQSHDRGLDCGRAGAVAAHVTASPLWVAFNGLTAGRAAAVQLGYSERIGESRIYVLPNSSGANASTPYAEKLEWWNRFRELVGYVVVPGRTYLPDRPVMPKWT
jgi:TDG/mug DNA glycosylase family protein